MWIQPCSSLAYPCRLVSEAIMSLSVAFNWDVIAPYQMVSETIMWNVHAPTMWHCHMVWSVNQSWGFCYCHSRIHFWRTFEMRQPYVGWSVKTSRAFFCVHSLHCFWKCEMSMLLLCGIVTWLFLWKYHYRLPEMWNVHAPTMWHCHMVIFLKISL